MGNTQLLIAIVILIGGFVLAVFEFLILPFILLLAVYTVVSAVIALWRDEPEEYAIEEIPEEYWDGVAQDIDYVKHIPVVFK